MGLFDALIKQQKTAPDRLVISQRWTTSWLPARTRAVIGILAENRPSASGAERAGFRPEFEHHYTCCLGFTWSRAHPVKPPDPKKIQNS